MSETKEDDDKLVCLDQLGFRGSILPTTAEELAQLLRQCDGPNQYISHTWGAVNGGLFWKRCPWVVPMLCDMRGIEMPPEVRQVFDKMKPEAI